MKMKLEPFGAPALFFLEISVRACGGGCRGLEGEKPEEQIDTDAELYDKM